MIRYVRVYRTYVSLLEQDIRWRDLAAAIGKHSSTPFRIGHSAFAYNCISRNAGVAKDITRRGAKEYACVFSRGIPFTPCPRGRRALFEYAPS